MMRFFLLIACLSVPVLAQAPAEKPPDEATVPVFDSVDKQLIDAEATVLQLWDAKARALPEYGAYQKVSGATAAALNAKYAAKGFKYDPRTRTLVVSK